MLQKKKQEEDSDPFDIGDDKSIAKEKESKTMKKEQQVDQCLLEGWYLVFQIKLFVFKLPKISEYMVN